jgi:hypothetical protein
MPSWWTDQNIDQALRRARQGQAFGGESLHRERSAACSKLSIQTWPVVHHDH